MRDKTSSFNFERSILTGYLEVATQLSAINNYEKIYDLKSKQMDALTISIQTANDLFASARADYFEVLMTQRDALDTKNRIDRNQKQQLNAVVNIYKGLGGGWR